MSHLSIDAIFPSAQVIPTSGAAACHGRAHVDGMPVVFFATDPGRARGALGVADGAALSGAIALARQTRCPLVWLLDSAGAKVDEGLPALAAFRRFYGEALLARQHGLRILAVLGRGCYGGASLLAMLAHHRIYAPHTRLSTSGPAIIEGVEGKERFDAADGQAVNALLGSQTRLAVDAGGECAEDTDLTASIARWLRAAADVSGWEAQHTRLAGRAPPARDIQDCRARMQGVLPPGYRAQQRGNIVYALPAAGTRKAVFCGFLTGGAFGAHDAWQLTDVLAGVARDHAGSPIVLVLDAAGHSARMDDERALLAEYLALLCRCVTDLSARGHRSALWILGGASGAVYVTFAAPVQQVSVLANARVEVLAAGAVDKILGRAVAGACSARELVDLGVADAVLDARLNNYGVT